VCLALANPARLPNPGGLARLGTLQQLRVQFPNGNEELHRFGDDYEAGPDLYWSPSLRALLVFPTTRPTKVRDFPHGMSEVEARRVLPDDLQPAVRLFRQWSIHDPSEIKRVVSHDWPLRVKGRPKHVVYRSSKFNLQRKLEDFLHPMPADDRVWFGPGKPPKVIAVSGPRLTVTEDGIVN
jgi:hypothetical protein